MGRRSLTGGVRRKGADRIQFDFEYNGERVRPTLLMTPTEGNLRTARKMLARIKDRIADGSFNFAYEFPGYRFLKNILSDQPAKPLLKELGEKYLSSCGELAHATKDGYRRILAFWERQVVNDKRLGEVPYEDIKYTDLALLVGTYPWGSKKTRNNRVSVLRQLLEFGYADIEGRTSPAERLDMLKVQKPAPDPYTLGEAEELIAGNRRTWGESFGNYVEFQFFAGARPSESIALSWDKVDLKRGRVRITEACVMGKHKKTTKTDREREVELNPRAHQCLKRQFEITGLAGKNVFGFDDGAPFLHLQIPWRRSESVHRRLRTRYREPYQARHTSVTWNLMIGKNFLWVAKNHGHSPAVMLKTYANWLSGSTDQDVEAIKRAMGFGTRMALVKPKIAQPIGSIDSVVAESEGFEPSGSSYEINNLLIDKGG